MRVLKPLEELPKQNLNIVIGIWLVVLFSIWALCGLGETHLFPTIPQVGHGFIELYNDGLVVHLFSSLSLCAQAVLISIVISLIVAYSSTIPLFKNISDLFSKLRYLPLTGITFYIAILINDGRSIQVWVLVVFMTCFLITSLLQMIKDIAPEEFDHARTLGCNRWEILWEVVIKGRFDYVIESIRQNLAIVWVMLVTTESILVAAGGLGVLIKNNDKMGNNGKVIAIQIIIILVGLSLDFILTKLRKLTFRYSKF